MKIVKTSELPWADALQKGKYSNRRKELNPSGTLRGGLWELAAGKKSFPFHVHHVTEEALFVVSGKAKVRTNDGLHEIGPGDWVSFPPGGTPHQLINDGTDPLVYLGVSANAAGADVVEYPDTGKLGTIVGGYPPAKRFMTKVEAGLDYFAGDKDAE